MDAGLINLISPLQKALKKYNNFCFVERVDSYIKDPVQTLLKDSNLEILKFLKDIKKMIEGDKINLKDYKKKKVFESLDKLDEPLLKKFIENHIAFKTDLSSIRSKIRNITILEEIENLEKKINIDNFKIENVEREIDKIKDIDIHSETKKLEEDLNNLFGYKILIENVMG